MMSFLQGRRHIVRLVERIGGSDTFAAGPIHGFGRGRDLEATRKSTVAASALKHICKFVFQKESS